MLNQWIVTASVLTAAVLLLRLAFRRRISQRLQYALWLPVLLRLLLPFALYSAPVSVSAAAERVAPGVFATPTPRPMPGEWEQPAGVFRPAVTITPAPAVTALPRAAATPAPMPAEPEPVPAAQRTDRTNYLPWIWLTGSGIMGLWLLGVNFRFSRRLRQDRTLFREGKTPVYVSASVASPCLFGLLKPAIYLTPQAAELPEDRLEQVLLHERTHLRRGDTVWCALRCLCLAVWWWNPLVWLAAAESRKDGELSCDEAVLRTLGEEKRLDYGHTLVDLLPQRTPGALLCTATISGGGRAMKERLERITKKPRALAIAAGAVLVLAAAIVLISFAGKGEGKPGVTPKPSATPQVTPTPAPGDTFAPVTEAMGRDWLTLPDGAVWLTKEELEDWEAWFGADWMRGQFLTSAYERPEDVDLHELFYIGADPEGHPLGWDITGRNPVTPEDKREYLAKLGQWITACPTDKLPRDQVDAVLRKYLGLGLEETGRVRLSYVYLPRTDCFYHAHGDTNLRGVPRLLYGYAQGDEVCLFYAGQAEYYGEEYRWGYETKYGVYRVVLRKEGEAVRFRSNMMARIIYGAEVSYEPPQPGPSVPEMRPAGEYGADVTKIRGELLEQVPAVTASMTWEKPGYGTLYYGEGEEPWLWFVTEKGQVWRLPTPATAAGKIPLDQTGGGANAGTGFFLIADEDPDLVVWSMRCPEETTLDDHGSVVRWGGTATWTLYLPKMEVYVYFRPNQERGEEPSPVGSKEWLEWCLGGDELTLTLRPNGQPGGDKTVTVSGPYLRNLLASYTWVSYKDDAEAEAVSEYALSIRAPGTELRMYQGRSMVSVTVDGQETLYRIPDRYTFVEDIRRQCFDPAEWNEAVSAIRVREGEEDAAAKFNTLWCESMKNLSPGSSYGVQEYRTAALAQEQHGEKNPIRMGVRNWYLPNEWNSVRWWSGAGCEPGEGEYEGWLREDLYFILELEDGYWRRTETTQYSLWTGFDILEPHGPMPVEDWQAQYADLLDRAMEDREYQGLGKGPLQGMALADLSGTGVPELLLFWPGGGKSDAAEIYTVEEGEVRSFTAADTLGLPMAKNAVKEEYYWANPAMEPVEEGRQAHIRYYCVAEEDGRINGGRYLLNSENGSPADYAMSLIAFARDGEGCLSAETWLTLASESEDERETAWWVDGKSVPESEYRKAEERYRDQLEVYTYLPGTWEGSCVDFHRIADPAAAVQTVLQNGTPRPQWLPKVTAETAPPEAWWPLTAEEGFGGLLIRSDIRPLSQEELSEWEAWFKADRFRLQFLASAYTRPEEVDLNELFYNGVPGERYLTQEDIHALLARFGDWFLETDTDVLPSSALDAALEEYLGLSLEETDRIRLTWAYLPETDCYYHPHGDTNAVSDIVFPFLYGYSRGDRVYLLYDGWAVPYFGSEYPLGYDYIYGVFRLELERVGDGVRFLSNQRVLTNGRAYELETPKLGFPCPEDNTGAGLDVTAVTLEGRVFESPEEAREQVENYKLYAIPDGDEDGKWYPLEILLEREYPGYGTLIYGETQGWTVPYFFFIAEDGRLYDLPMPMSPGYVCMDLDGSRDPAAGQSFAYLWDNGRERGLACWWMRFTEETDLCPTSPFWTGGSVRRERGSAQWSLYLPTMEVFILFTPEAGE